MDTRELDARVAREVMGFKDYEKDHIFPTLMAPNGDIVMPPSYSTDMNRAMEVVANFDALGWIWTLQSELKDRWRVMLTRGPNEWIRVASDDGLPHAICLAALDAVAGRDKP